MASTPQTSFSVSGLWQTLCLRLNAERAIERVTNVVGTYNDLKLRIFSKHPESFPEEVFNLETFKWSLGILFSRLEIRSMDLDVASPKKLNRRVFLKQLTVDLCTSERGILFYITEKIARLEERRTESIENIRRA